MISASFTGLRRGTPLSVKRPQDGVAALQRSPPLSFPIFSSCLKSEPNSRTLRRKLESLYELGSHHCEGREGEEECSIAQAHRNGPRAKAAGDWRGRAAILQGGSLTPSRAPYAERTRNPLAQQQRVRGAKASRLRDRRRVSTNARAVGLETSFRPTIIQHAALH